MFIIRAIITVTYFDKAYKIICSHLMTNFNKCIKEAFFLPVVGMGPSWPSIEQDHSGITAHLKTVTFNVCETLNLGV